MNNNIIKSIPMEVKGGIIAGALTGGAALLGSTIGIITGVNKTGKSWNEFTDEEKERVAFCCKRALRVVGIATLSGLAGYLIGYVVGDAPSRILSEVGEVPAHSIKVCTNPMKLTTMKKYVDRVNDSMVCTMDSLVNAVKEGALDYTSEAGKQLVENHYAFCESLAFRPKSAEEIIPEVTRNVIASVCYDA